MNEFYTTNLSDFGYREISILKDLLHAWLEQGLPPHFENSGVHPAMNRQSGYVFLMNEFYQVAMLNGNVLEQYYTLPFSSTEGFLSDIVCENNPCDFHRMDVERILVLAAQDGFNLPLPWLDLQINFLSKRT